MKQESYKQPYKKGEDDSLFTETDLDIDERDDELSDDRSYDLSEGGVPIENRSQEYHDHSMLKNTKLNEQPPPDAQSVIEKEMIAYIDKVKMLKNAFEDLEKYSSCYSSFNESSSEDHMSEDRRYSQDSDPSQSFFFREEELSSQESMSEEASDRDTGDGLPNIP